MSTSIKYAYRKGQTWLYRRTYPIDLQPVLGSSLKQSLKTTDLRVAKARVHEVNATYDDLVAKARAEQSQRTGETETATSVRVLRPRFRIEQVGRETIAALVPRYLNQRSAELSPGGFKSHRYSLRLFASTFGSREIGSLTRQDGQTFLARLQELSPHAGKGAGARDASLEALVKLSRDQATRITPQTQRRIWSQVGQFVDWCIREGYLEVSRFETLEVTAKPEVQSYGILSDAEVAALLGVGDPILPPILLVSLLSGMRSGEVCGLLAEDVAHRGNLGAFFRVRSNALRSLKTRAAERDVPVHDVLERRVLPTLPKSGPLFPGVSVDRVTKHFARARKDLGLERDGVVFHSARKWFITQCERTGVPEHFTASLVGHQTARSRNQLTYSLYSAGISDAQKREIIDQIRLPREAVQ